MKLVIDASVALKWVLDEDSSAEAMALIEPNELVAPDLLLIECANTLAMRVRRTLLSVEDSQVALSRIVAVPKRLHGAAGFVERAYALAMETDRSAYDCLYLAVADGTGGTMVTSDRKFAEAIHRHGRYADLVRML